MHLIFDMQWFSKWKKVSVPFLLSLLMVGIASGQIIPGQLPKNAAPPPPPPPGQLSDKPVERTPDNGTNEPAQQEKEEPPANDGDKPYTIRTSVKRVVVPTTVFDRDTKEYVSGLTASDFEIYDNDKPQRLEAEILEQPMSVVLAVQANSDVEEFLPKLKKSASLLHGLVTGVDGDVAILAFDHRMQHLQEFTSDPEKLDDAMDRLRAGSSSAAIIDAVVEGDHMLRARDPYKKRRRVIILLSRDINKGSQAKLRETITQIQFDSIVIYCIDISKALSAFLKKPDFPRPLNGGIPSEGMPQPIAGGAGVHTQTQDIQQANGNALNAVPPLMRSIHDLFKKTPAEAFTYFTGGRVYSFATVHGLERAISDVGRDLNSQYILTYAPSKETESEPGFHNIRVVVKRPGMEVRTRPGYWWGGGQIQ